MLRTPAPALSLTLRRFRSFAGLAAAIVPFAIVVHLVAEAAAAGPQGLGVAFVLRHAYFGLLFAATAGWFGWTAGLGRSPGERRRRCALLRSELSGPARPHRLVLLVGANLGFFALTQAVEGIPIASGALFLGLGVALAGSLLAALLVFIFGSCLLVAGLDAVIGTSPMRRTQPTREHRARRIAAPRHATFAYSLFVPNRPPPARSRF